MSQENSESAIFSDWTPKWMRQDENHDNTQEGPDDFKEALKREATPDFAEAMRDVEAAHAGIFDEGVEKAHTKIAALREEYRNNRDEEAEDRRFEAEYKKIGPEAAEALARDRADQGSLKHFEYPAPVWQQTTGLFPQWENKMNPNERAGRIAKLLRTVERMVKFEMRTMERGRPAPALLEDGEASVIKETYLWDPLRAVCFKLEISLAQLSRYAKETTGMSATEIVDCLRMQRARKKMKEDLRDFIAQIKKEKVKSKKERQAEDGAQLKCETSSEVARATAANGMPPLPVAHANLQSEIGSGGGRGTPALHRRRGRNLGGAEKCAARAALAPHVMGGTVRVQFAREIFPGVHTHVRRGSA